METRVSIILPTYNGSSHIAKAILSVKVQSYSDWELLVIDDGSTDMTESVVLKFANADARIHYIKNEQNIGIQKTLNRGIRQSRGEFIARIDDDDEWSDIDKLKKQVEFLDNHKDYIIVGTGAVIVDDNGKELSRYFLPENDIDVRKKILSKNCFVHASVLFRKGDIQYSENTNTKHIEDYDLWLRLGLRGKFHNLPIYAVIHRVGDGTLTGANRVMQARNMFRRISKSRKEYPNFIFGLIISFLRLLFFCLEKYLPFSKKNIYKIQTVYKNI